MFALIRFSDTFYLVDPKHFFIPLISPHPPRPPFISPPKILYNYNYLKTEKQTYFENVKLNTNLLQTCE